MRARSRGEHIQQDDDPSNQARVHNCKQALSDSQGRYQRRYPEYSRVAPGRFMGPSASSSETSSDAKEAPQSEDKEARANVGDERRRLQRAAGDEVCGGEGDARGKEDGGGRAMAASNGPRCRQDEQLGQPNEATSRHDDIEVRDEGEVFVESVLKRWIKSEDPRQVISDTDLNNVAVQCNSKLNTRVAYNGNDDLKWIWSFEVVTQGTKCLTHVSLATKAHRDNFCIKSINSEGISYNENGQHFVAPRTSYPVNDKPSVRLYMIDIEFLGNTTGTYYQDIIFGFNEGPAMRRQVCLDYVSKEDMNRLEAAREYLMYLTQHNSHKQNTPIVPFCSPFVPELIDRREEKITGLYPVPQLDSFTLTHATLKDNLLDPKNYKKRLHELITIEEMARREQIARYNEITELRLSKSYIIASDTEGDTLAKYAATGELFAQLPLGREISEDTKSGRLVLRGCSSLYVQKIDFGEKGASNNSRPTLGDKIFEAHIEDKCNHVIYARLSMECVQHLGLAPDSNVKMLVQFVMNRAPFCEWRRAVDALPDTSIVFPDSVAPRRARRNGFAQDDLRYEWSPEWTVEVKDCRLNEKQKEAVAVMMAPTTEKLPPVLILGPFGTGKTSTIAQAIRILLVNDPDSRVILCTHSNSAADLYVKEFFDVWYNESQDPRLKPLRIYFKGRLRSTVHPIVREYCLHDESGRFRHPSSKDLMEYGLIISTLATSSNLSMLQYEPTHIIVDEAAQALECEALACLALATERTRIVLAGDQMQLAPEVYSDLARERGLGMSLLERIHLTYERNHPCRIQLCRNYRAHEDIVKLTSELFYGGQIEPGATLPRHPHYAPLSFYACEGEVQQGSNSTGFFNNHEAHEVAERVAELRRNWPTEQWGQFNENSIGVLAHYAEQVLRIRSELRKRRLATVNVERVLNVQGKQFTAVFISVVRNRNCSRLSAERQLSDYGFLTNARLLNTAITRAKSLVVVVGDPVALLSIGSCKELWRQYLRNANVHGMDQRELVFHLNQSPEKSIAPALNPLAKEFVPRTGTQSENPVWVEYVTMPINYPVIHCSVDSGGVV